MSKETADLIIPFVPFVTLILGTAIFFWPKKVKVD